MSKEAREERKKRLARSQPGAVTGRRIAIAAAAIVLLVGVGYGFTLLPDPPKNVHWHPMYEVYVEGENVAFTSRAFDMSATRASMHLHNPDDNTVHAEGRTTSLTIGQFFLEMGGRVTDDTLTVPAAASVPGTFTSNETSRLRLFHQPAGEGWSEVGSGFAKHKFEDGERVLLTFGNLTDAQILAQQESVAQPRADAASAMAPGTAPASDEAPTPTPTPSEPPTPTGP